MLFSTRWFDFLLAVVILASLEARSQDLTPYPINPKVLPRFPDNPVSNLPVPEKVKLGNDVPGVVPPAPPALALAPMSSDCRGVKDAGTVTLSFIIDSRGEPRNVIFKRALASQVDLLALKILLDSRFQPATVNGSPIAFGRDVEMHLEVCIERQAGAAKEMTRLRTAKDVRFTDWRNAATEASLAPSPMPPDARADGEHPGADGFTEPKAIAHKNYDSQGMSGSFSFGMLIDEHGISHIEKVLRSTNPALLPVAASMVLSIRHTPAMKDGMPVPAHVTEALDIRSGN